MGSLPVERSRRSSLVRAMHLPWQAGFQMAFGSLEDFFKGLEGLIGTCGWHA